MTPTKTVWAAGGVLWRTNAQGKLEVAVVHRKRYDDWSLPKGKADDGEVLVATAVREMVEETGFRSRVGRNLGLVQYKLKSGAKKRVAYWSMEATGGRFTSNSETDDIQWLPVSAAQKTVSYDADRDILESFAAQDDSKLHHFVVVRHATAGRRSRFSGDDTKRPLDSGGQHQAIALAPLLGLFGVHHLHAADRVRCIETLVPYAEQLHTEITVEPLLTEEAVSDDLDASYARLRELAAAGDDRAGVRAVCSQGRAILPLLERWAADDGIELPPNRNRKGSFWLLSLRDGNLVQADHFASPLPGKTGH